MWHSSLRLLAAGLFSKDPTSVSDSLERERKGGYDEKGTRLGACPTLVLSPGWGGFWREKNLQRRVLYLKVRLQPGAICALSLFSVYPMLRRGFFAFSPGTLVFLPPQKRYDEHPCPFNMWVPLERSTPPSPPPLVPFLIWKWKLTETFEIQLLSGPVHFSS